MSSPVDGTEKHHDHSAYAPKRVRDFNREGSYETTSTAADQHPQHSEQPPSREGSGKRAAPLTSVFRYDLLERITAYSADLEPAR
jgi:hypothetical protein